MGTLIYPPSGPLELWAGLDCDYSVTGSTLGMRFGISVADLENVDGGSYSEIAVSSMDVKSGTTEEESKVIIHDQQ